MNTIKDTLLRCSFCGKTQEDVKKEGDKNTLGQEDFLKLITTQLQNQDSFAPMDNGDFIAQMA